MNLSLFIARRYFFSKKKKNFINIISIISMVVVATGTMALVVVLSVFNGLEGMLRSVYGTIDPNLVIQIKEGKSFVYTHEMKKMIAEISGVELVTEVIEDNALLKYHNSQRVARLKGVDENFLRDGRINANIVYGKPVLEEGDINYAMLGRGVQYDLSVNPGNDFTPIQVYYPDEISPRLAATNPEKMFRIKNITPGAVFAVENYFDNTYVLVPIRFNEALFGYESNQRTALEVKVAPENLGDVQVSLSAQLGDRFSVLNSEELNVDIYKTLRIEKFFLFLTFSVILAVASINIYFALTMLVMDKKRDIAIFLAQGATKRFIRNIFLMEGMIVAFSGALVGLLFGLGICLMQQQFGLVTTGTQTTLMTAYPVEVKVADLMYTAMCIIIITLLATIHPAITASRGSTHTSL